MILGGFGLKGGYELMRLLATNENRLTPSMSVQQQSHCILI